MNPVEHCPIFPEEDLLFGTLRRPLADPLGSYTGVPLDVTEKPVQDADDL